jgi:hypothetical protein
LVAGYYDVVMQLAALQVLLLLLLLLLTIPA